SPRRSATLNRTLVTPVTLIRPPGTAQEALDGGGFTHRGGTAGRRASAAAGRPRPAGRAPPVRTESDVARAAHNGKSDRLFLEVPWPVPLPEAPRSERCAPRPSAWAPAVSAWRASADHRTSGTGCSRIPAAP